MLFGLNEDGNERGLKTYGMTVVELEDPSGNPLQLAAGSPVEMTTDIPASLQGDAPATIPLWYFDEEMGIWMEEGSAELVNGDTYIGKVDALLILELRCTCQLHLFGRHSSSGGKRMHY